MKMMIKSPSPLMVTSDDLLKKHKQKIMKLLFWVISIFSLMAVLFVLVLRLTTSNFMPIQDQQFFLLVGISFLLTILIVTVIEHYLSFEIASIVFNLLLLVVILFSDTPSELTDGRSLILLILPVVTASILLRPWAGLVVAGFYGTFISIYHISYYQGLPNIPAILILFLVAFIIQQATSNLELAMGKLEQTMQTLQEKEEHFRALFESSTDINAILNHEGVINYVSPSVERVLGYKAEDLVGQTILNYLHPEDIDISLAALGPDVPAEAIGPMLILRLRHRNGSWVTLETIGRELFDNRAIQGTIVNCRDITDRRQVEINLRESEEKFSKAFQLSPMPMAITSLDGKYIEVNQSFTKALGYLPKEVAGRTAVEIGILAEPGQYQKILKTLNEQGNLKNYEMSVRTRSGEILQGVFFSEPMQLNGQLLMLTLMNDITEQKRMEIELRKSEEKYRSLIETLPIGVIIHQQGIIQFINSAGARIMGAKTPGLLVGTPIMDRVHPDFQKKVQTRLQTSLSSFTATELLVEKLVRIDGTPFDAEVIGHPVQLGDMPVMVAMFEDVTERKQAEEKLRKSEENFWNLSENSVDGIVIVSREGRHLYANPQACELLQYSPEEILQKYQVDVVAPEVFPLLQKRLDDRLAGKPLPKRYETILWRKDGSRFPVEISGTRTTWQDEVCDLVIFRDITERRQTQEAIRSQNQRIQDVSRQLVKVQEREKRMLASELHDDLGQSLTSLKLMLELASSTRSNMNKRNMMEDSLILVSELMGKVRNLSLDLRPAMLDDFGLFTALRWLFERFHNQTGVVVRCDYNLDDDQRFDPAIETAAFRITQEALTNVARYAGVREAEVHLEIGEKMSIEIIDQGAGFGYLQEIHKPVGSLGLSGMQERARLLGGQVEIFSEKGGGTRVLATIPLSGDSH
jgi:PAS domain S-box-containing protein